MLPPLGELSAKLTEGVSADDWADPLRPFGPPPPTGGGSFNQSRNSSLMLVLERVRSSTVFMITAQ
jgi:hypothetical protein